MTETQSRWMDTVTRLTSKKFIHVLVADETYVYHLTTSGFYIENLHAFNRAIKNSERLTIDVDCDKFYDTLKKYVDKRVSVYNVLLYMLKKKTIVCTTPIQMFLSIETERTLTPDELWTSTLNMLECQQSC